MWLRRPHGGRSVKGKNQKPSLTPTVKTKFDPDRSTELAERLGLGRPDSVPNLTRRVDKLLRDSRPFAAELGEIIQRLEGDGEEPMRVGRKTKNQV
jgi:hypothetical protein